jgi:molecular chaperone GrpE
LTKQLIEAKFKAEKYWESVLRQRAETENVRKRMERELDKVRQYALEKFAHALLPVKDSMELGLEAAKKTETDIQTVRDGLALTLKMLSDVLGKFDIIEINPQDEKFDPQLHEAMTVQVVPTVPDNTVIYVHQKGYELNKRLLRPARVVVSKLP